MILTCPACSTRYLTDPAALGPTGRMVRCAKCDHTWMQTPPADMPRHVDGPPPPGAASSGMPPPGAASSGTPIGRISLPALRPPDRRRQRYGILLLSGILVGLILGLGVFGRDRIIAVWPSASAFYDLVGLESMAVGAGLELNNVRFVRRRVEGDDVIIVEGEVLNRTAEALPVPALRATLRNENNQWLKDWTFRIDRTELEPGETVSFRTTTRNPPEASRRLSITFVDDAG